MCESSDTYAQLFIRHDMMATVRNPGQQYRFRAGLLLLVTVALLLAFNAASQPPKPTAPVPSQFTDIALRVRFDYVTRNDFRDRKYFPQPMCGGVAIFDFDNDGWQDIFFTNGSELPSMQRPAAFNNCLLHNRHDGTFDDQTAAAGLLGKDMGYSLGVAVGDYDNDGFADLFICNLGENKLLHNNHNGTFTDVTPGAGLGKPQDTISVDAAWFDYDGDSLPDLLVSDYTKWTPAADFRCVDAQKREIYCSPTRYISVPDRLYRNLGNGKFEDITAAAGLSEARGKGMGISIADVDRDGRPDVFVVNDTERNFLFMNQGGGKFRELGVPFGVAYNDDGVTVNGMGSDAKDYDNDGFPDFFYNNLPSQVFALFRNEAGKAFRYVSPAAALGRLSYRFGGWSAGFIDYDNDGWKDIYSANGDVDYLGDNAKQADTMFRNEGGKTFSDASPRMGSAFTRLGYHRGASFGDLNNDGSLDIVVTGLNERPRILMNAGNKGRHWLSLELTGTKASRDAVGANVKVTTASGRTLINHVAISIGLLSSSEKRVHFGLGSEAEIKTVEIQWPGGQVQTLNNVRADQFLKVREP